MQIHSNNILAVPDNELNTITCNNEWDIITFVTDLKLHTKEKLTSESDCMALGSTFTLLGRYNIQKELSDYSIYNLIITNLNITCNEVNKNIINNFDKFSILHTNLLLKHVTHQMNLNMASIRITKL